MFKPTRMSLLAITLIAALLLSACGSALGNTTLNELILTATALSGTTVFHPDSGTETPELTETPEATEVQGTGTAEATASPEESGTPHGSVTPKATEGNNSHEVFGVVQAYTPATAGTPGSIMVNGVTYMITDQSVVSKCNITVGTAVHLEFGINPDGTFFVHHLGLATGNGIGDCGGNGQGQNGQGHGEGQHNSGTPGPGGGD
jgi:hypothetical protein